MLRTFFTIAGLTLTGIAAIISKVNFNNVITTGSIIVGILVAIATVITMSYGAKWKPTAQAAIARADELDKELVSERARHEQCSIERKAAEKQVTDLKQVNARLEALPNLALVLEQMSKEAQRIDEHAKARLALALETVNSSFREHTSTVVQAIHELSEEMKK